MDGWIIIGGVLGAQLDLRKSSPFPLPASLMLCCSVSNKAITYERLTYVTYCGFFVFFSYLVWFCSYKMGDTLLYPSHWQWRQFCTGHKPAQTNTIISTNKISVCDRKKTTYKIIIRSLVWLISLQLMIIKYWWRKKSLLSINTALCVHMQVCVF